MTTRTSNIAFLPPALKDLAEASRKAEEHIMGDPRAIRRESSTYEIVRGPLRIPG